MIGFGDAASGAAVVCGAGCRERGADGAGRGVHGGGGGAGRADRVAAGRGGGAAPAGGPGFLEFLAAAEPGQPRVRGEGEGKGGQPASAGGPAAGWPEGPSGRWPADGRPAG